MLYNPKWQSKTAAPSLAGLVAWLEMQDPDAKYNFDDCKGKCLVALYCRSENPSWEHGRDYMDSCRQIFGGNGYDVGPACEEPWTFGEALNRALAALPSEERKERS